MNGNPVTKEEILKIIQLRQTGHSLPEIMHAIKRGSSTVFRYAKDVRVLPEYISALNIKQGGSRKKATYNWNLARIKAGKMIPDRLSADQRMYLLLALYWGEGSKRELSLLNSDPALIKIFVQCLYDLGVQKKDVKYSLRLHDDLNVNDSVNFWSGYLEIESNMIISINIINGNKKGKLKYGMCRVRVAKSARYFKLLMSLIEQVKLKFNAPVVQWIE